MLNPSEIAIYLRISKEDKNAAEGGSVESQLHRCKQRLASMGITEAQLELVKVYRDEGFSGKNTNRPDFLKLQKDVRLGRIKVLVFAELSRISRNLKDFLEISDIWHKQEVQWVSLRENFDTTSLHGRLIINILMSLYQFEREQTAYRTRSNMHSRAQRGMWNGGVTPWGYETSKTVAGGLVVNEEEARGVRELFKVYLELGSCLETAKALTARGHRNKKGKAINTAMVEHSLHNAVYIGLKSLNMANKGLSPEEQEKLPEDERYELVPALWTPIVDKQTWDLVQERFEAGRGTNLVKPNKVHDFVLTGLVTCVDCGQFLEGAAAKHQQYLYYKHPAGTSTPACQRTSWSALVIEQGVLNRLAQYVEKPAIFDLVVDEANKAILEDLPIKQAELDEANRKCARLSDEIEALGERLATLPRGMDPTFIYSSVTRKQAELDDSRSNLRRLEGDVRDAESRRLTSSGFTEVFGQLLVAYDHLNAFERKQTLACVFDRIELGMDTVRLVLADEPAEVTRTPEMEKPGTSRYRAIHSWLRLARSGRTTEALFYATGCC